MTTTLLSTHGREDQAEKLSVEDLWLAYRSTGSREVRDRLVLHYAGLVTYVASRAGAGMPSSVDYSDLIQSGLIGLMDALDRFEPERGLKFETYAVVRIRGSILDGLRALDWVPRSVRKKARDLDSAAEGCATRLGRTPTAAEVADELGIEPDALGGIRAQMSRMHVGALDEMSGGSGAETLSLAETLADPFAEQPGDAMMQADLREALWAVLDELSERDRAVLVHSFIDGLTLGQIGGILGVTESRVCQLRGRALREVQGRLTSRLANSD